jgi:hypothetical protein
LRVHELFSKAFTTSRGAPTMLVSVALALLLLPRGAEASRPGFSPRLLADVLAGRSVSLRVRGHECKAALVSTRVIDAAIRDDGVKWWLVPRCMLGGALPNPTTARPWRAHNGGMMNIDALKTGLYR